MSTILKITFIFLAFWSVQTNIAAQDVEYQYESLLHILQDVEESTEYHILYREPLVAGIRLSLSTNQDNIFSDLQKSLIKKNIGLTVHHDRKQVLIYELSTVRKNRVTSVNGYVVDHVTGERLPYATISWYENGTRKGLATNQSGSFSLERMFSDSTVTLFASYVGYGDESVDLNLSEKQNWTGITIRLRPVPFSSEEIIVNGITYFNPADTVFTGLLETGNFSPLGENNSVRALQTLPAVNVTNALNDGINVRGSPVNGFKVLLDGVSVFNQSHLFGLLDSFNPDVLQNSGFFYDVTPAQFESPTGGTLALITRTGSLTEYGANLGVSNTAYRATFQGPISTGKSSFLISGRKSYMNTIDWFGNRNLIEYGLNIDRPSSATDIELPSLSDLLVDPGNYNANFYDLHAKLYVEGEGGDRFQLSGYIGEDETEQIYERCFVQSSNNLCPVQFSNFNQNFFRLRELATENRWGNKLVSASYQFKIGDSGYAESLAGFSDYNTFYHKDDFVYQRENQGRRETILRPYSIENTVSEFRFRQSFDLKFGLTDFYTALTYFNYQLEYFEDSFRRLNFFNQSDVSQFDLSVQLDFNQFQNVRLNAGNRFQYYSAGEHFRWSPGIKMHLYPSHPLSFSVGYSRNHQFLNRISLSNINTAEIWVPSNENQHPTRSDLFSTGLYLKISPVTYLRVEGYLKMIDNMRLHESQTRFIPATLESDVPWYYQNELTATGLEFLFRHQFGKFTFSQSYTLSDTEIENPRINSGDPFHPDWDRRHQLYSSGELQVTENLQFNVSSTFATGTPDQLFKILEATQNPGNIEITNRMKNYFRLDASLVYRIPDFGNGLEIKLFIFNILDRDNEWYREFGTFVEENPGATARDRFTMIGLPVSVYDLGFQPSFNVKLEI